MPTEPIDVEVRAAVFVACARAWLTAGAGNLDGAAGLARAAGSRAIDSTYRLLGTVALYQAVRLGAASSVADLLARSAAHIGEGLVPVMASHARALLEGDGDAADRAAQSFCGMGARLAAAETYAHAAVLHERRARDISARRSACLSSLIQRTCPGAATPALRGRPASISDREAEVAALACEGLSAREISQRLFRSRRTVDNHLGSTYRQLGLHSRGELQNLIAPVLLGPGTRS